MRKKHKSPGVVFDNPAASLLRATTCSHEDRQRVARHMRESLGGCMLPPVVIDGTPYPAREFRP